MSVLRDLIIFGNINRIFHSSSYTFTPSDNFFFFFFSFERSLYFIQFVIKIRVLRRHNSVPATIFERKNRDEPRSLNRCCTYIRTYVGVQVKEDACMEETEITKERKGRVTRRGKEKRRHVGKGKEHFGRGSGNVLIARTKVRCLELTKRESSPPPLPSLLLLLL